MSSNVKYHVNPDTGKTGKCRARTKPCRWGDKDSHFNTEVAARAFYEMKMRDQELAETQSKQDQLILAEFRKHFPEADGKEKEATVSTGGFKKRSEWLNEAQIAKINVDGILCPSCGDQIAAAQAAHILSELNSASCSSCGESFDLHSVAIKVGKTKNTYRAFDASEVSKMTWYHSTYSSEWDSEITKKGGFVAHLGSAQAAYDRRIAEDYSIFPKKSGFWLYEVDVAPEAHIAEKIDSDENADYESGDRMKNADVVRYVNKWEDMASISLAAKSNSLTVKSRRYVTADEVMSSPSLYNIDPSSIE